MEKFSVLMSVYAREQSTYLEEALRSVFEQTVPPSEVVLVKDGPLTTELETVIASFAERYKSLKIVALAKNMGLGNALNVGLSACTYRLVARMDSDDLSLPNRFETQLKAFEKDLEVSVVGGWISEFENNPKQIISYRKVPEFDCEIKHFFFIKMSCKSYDCYVS
ncbi:glycosyltransferase [Bacteroides faecis]|uniref:Glycosyltransferase n=1 Tax=Bacteroides faecis TaxID=674529 RepID=A0AAW5P1C1_9BACE|nr:glycosyltransferase [Bacteroides faecis]MCS2794563.1 glycosyltransferase [Bacteroides faecis]